MALCKLRDQHAGQLNDQGADDDASNAPIASFVWGHGAQGEPRDDHQQLGDNQPGAKRLGEQVMRQSFENINLMRPLERLGIDAPVQHQSRQ